MSQILNTILGQDEENDGVLTQQDTETVAPASPPATDGTGGGDTGGGNTGSGTGNSGGNGGGDTGGSGTQTTGSVVPAPAKKEEQPTHFSYLELTKQMNPYKAPTQEELEKERKKQKRDKIFAAIGDGLSAFHVAYANAYGTKPIVDIRNSMSGKVRNRYEQLQKERDAKKMEYMNAYLRAQQLDDEAARDQRNWKRQLERDKVADDRDKRDFDNRVHQQEVQQQQWQQSFDRQGEQWKKQFEESKRQFNISSAQQAQRISMESKRLANELQKDNVSFALGTGKGTITVPTNALNSSNVSFVFSKLPQNVRDQVKGEPIYNATKTKIEGYQPPTTDAMLIAIGSNIDKSTEAQDALRQIAGQKVNNNNNNTPPSRRKNNNNDNTPPSKRK